MQGVSRTVFLLEALSGAGGWGGSCSLAFNQALEATCIPWPEFPGPFLCHQALHPSFHPSFSSFLISSLPPSTFSLPFSLSPSIFTSPPLSVPLASH